MNLADKELERVTICCVECLYNIPIKNDYHKYTHVILFTTEDHKNYYYWETTTSDGLRFERGEVYNLTAKIDRADNRLYYVKVFDVESKLDHPATATCSHIQKPDCYDILLGKTN